MKNFFLTEILDCRSFVDSFEGSSALKVASFGVFQVEPRLKIIFYQVNET